MLIDSHCHLDYLVGPDSGRDIGAILDAASAAGVGRMLTVAVGRANIDAVLAHARGDERVFASAGMHPMSCGEETPFSEEELLAHAADPRVIAFGETGLDYYYSTEHAGLQRQSFIAHLRAGSRAGLPVIVHTRNAREDTLRLLREHADPRHAGVMHCFTEDAAMAAAVIELNFMISFSGIITFRTAGALREVVREVPLERILVETDSPYLAPVPYRGRMNEPCRVIHVAEAVAAIKDVPVAAVIEATGANFHALFRRAAQAGAWR